VINHSLCEFNEFSGFLKALECSAPVTFRTRINPSGEIEFDFDEIVLTKETNFIENHWYHKGSSLSHFSLIGNAIDGTEITTDSLYFSSCGFSSLINLKGGRCSKAIFHRTLSEPRPKSLLCMCLRGVRSAHPLKWQCQLGIISMFESPRDDLPNTVNGYITIESDIEIFDRSVWHNKANNLLDHIRRVMSFATGINLRAPISEFYSDDKLEVEYLSQIRQAPSSSFPVFGYVNLQPIFEVAVTSFFNPPYEVKNLYIAIDWFSMDSIYAEVRLVNAMTVLENLVSSNLNDDDTLILNSTKFKKLRKSLETIIRDFPLESAENPTVNLHAMINHLPNLNRKSILQKLNILAERWMVPLNGISQKQITAAKNARDSIVHQGLYNKGNAKELWEHAMVVREIVTRFLFIAIGYQGEYISHLGGCHKTWFPPNIEAD